MHSKLALPLFALPFASAASQVTWNDVAPILYARCAGCHHAGDIAPMALLTYKDARPWAAAIRQAVIPRRMPPWHADPHFGEFANDRRLGTDEIDKIRTWAETGAREGDPSKAPQPPAFPEAWKLGKPDAIIPIPRDFRVAANGPDEYVSLTVPTTFKEDVWVQAV